MTLSTGPSLLVGWGRVYLAVQGVLGLGWNVLAWHSISVRSATLGDLAPSLILWPDLVLFAGASLLAAATARPLWAWVTAGWSGLVTLGLTIYGLVTREAGTGVALMWPALVASVGAALVLSRGSIPRSWFFVGPFALAEAPPASPGAHFRRSVQQLLAFWVGFFVALAGAIAWAEHRLRLDLSALDQPWVGWCGVAVAVGGSVMGFAAMRVMSRRGLGTPLPSAHATHLVTEGPYAVVRNPMATAGALQTLGMGAVMGSWAVWCGAVVGGFFWHVVIRPVEEDDLVRRFGADYDAYRRRVPLWSPRPTASGLVSPEDAREPD